jgi:predicted short-subunit dehydrogenase-like oxidoreductase (DUF2520 family)
MEENINIIGCGRAAGSLARLWQQAGVVKIADVMNRSLASSRAAVGKLAAGRAAASIVEMAPAPYWLIGTGDEQIEGAAALLARQGRYLEGSVAFHLCGRHGIEILQPLEDAGCLVAAVHPVRSLTHSNITIGDFTGTACVAEGGGQALDALRGLFSGIGGEWLPVSRLDRGLYHAAVSIISNITKGVAWKAEGWMEHAGLDEETAGIVTHNLLSSTMEDLAKAGARQSITGPIVRGDTSTVEAHIQALIRGHPEDVEMYRVLAGTVLELAAERGDLDASTLARFEALLKNSG